MFSRIDRKEQKSNIQTVNYGGRINPKTRRMFRGTLTITIWSHKGQIAQKNCKK